MRLSTRVLNYTRMCYIRTGMVGPGKLSFPSNLFSWVRIYPCKDLFFLDKEMAPFSTCLIVFHLVFIHLPFFLALTFCIWSRGVIGSPANESRSITHGTCERLRASADSTRQQTAKQTEQTVPDWTASIHPVCKSPKERHNLTGPPVFLFSGSTEREETVDADAWQKGLLHLNLSTAKPGLKLTTSTLKNPEMLHELPHNHHCYGKGCFLFLEFKKHNYLFMVYKLILSVPFPHCYMRNISSLVN